VTAPVRRRRTCAATSLCRGTVCYTGLLHEDPIRNRRKTSRGFGAGGGRGRRRGVVPRWDGREGVSGGDRTHTSPFTRPVVSGLRRVPSRGNAVVAAGARARVRYEHNPIKARARSGRHNNNNNSVRRRYGGALRALTTLCRYIVPVYRRADLEVYALRSVQ